MARTKKAGKPVEIKKSRRTKKRGVLISEIPQTEEIDVMYPAVLRRPGSIPNPPQTCEFSRELGEDEVWADITSCFWECESNITCGAYSAYRNALVKREAMDARRSKEKIDADN